MDCWVSGDAGLFCVRAERSGLIQEGRRYAVEVTATDDCGNQSPPTVIGNIYVPHDRGKDTDCGGEWYRGKGDRLLPTVGGLDPTAPTPPPGRDPRNDRRR